MRESLKAFYILYYTMIDSNTIAFIWLHISKQQLLRSKISCIVSWIIGIGAIIAACIIFRKQINLSKEQWKIIDKQTNLIKRQEEFSIYVYNIDKAKYELDKLTNNLDTGLLKIIARKITKYLDKDTKVVEEVTNRLKNVDEWIGEVNKTITDAIKNYKKALDNKPERIEFMEELP
jgi:vacuolar-type H+-ATPase subunit I/STV1